MYINQVDLLFDIVGELIVSLSDEKLKQLVEKNPHSIILMKNPPSGVMQYAVRNSPELIEYITNPDQATIDIALKHDPTLIRFIQYPSLKTALELIKIDIVRFLPLINNKDQEFFTQVLKLNPHNIKFIPKEFLPEEANYDAIKENPDSLQAISEEDQTEKLCIEAVTTKGRSLRFVKKQTYNIIMAAINQDVNAFKYLDPNVLSSDQIEEIRELIKIKKIELEIAKKLGPKK